MVNNFRGTCSEDGKGSFTLSTSEGLTYENGGMDNDGGGFYAENICLLALYGENASSYISKGNFSRASYVVGGGSWRHIHGISSAKMSDIKILKDMGLFYGPCCYTSWTSLTCSWNTLLNTGNTLHHVFLKRPSLY